MNRRTIEEAIVFITLLCGGIFLRGWLDDQSFRGWFPIIAIAMFAGFYFSWKLVAAALPLLIMAITDVRFGGYDWGIQATVYAMVTLPVVARYWLGHRSPATTSHWAKVVGTSVGGAIAFFVVTNFAVFLVWSDRTWADLVNFYLLGLPFFRATIVGNLVASVALFGAYQLVRLTSRAQASVPEVQQS